MLSGFEDISPQFLKWFEKLAADFVPVTAGPTVPTIKKTKPKSMIGPHAGGKTLQVVNHNYNTVVNANHPKEHISTTLRRHDFWLRNNRPR